MNNIIEQDINYIVNNALALGFRDKTFLVTGATGMIGKLLVNVLKRITPENKIVVLGKDISEAKSFFKNSKMVCSSFDLLNLIDYDIDFVIHLASPTNSKYLAENAVETIDFIYNSTKKMLDFALTHNSKVLYISSMEVYGEVLDKNIRSESDIGYLSLSNTRNSYSEAKRLCELLCNSYYKEYGVQVCCARLAQTFGAGTPKNDPRIFGYLARCVIDNKDIVLNTKGDSYGNYCYLADTINAFFFILSYGNSGETYNVVGDNCRCTILELSELVSSKIANNKINVKISLNNSGIYPNPTKLNMSNFKIKSLGWKPKYDLLDMFNRMLTSWKQ